MYLSSALVLTLKFYYACCVIYHLPSTKGLATFCLKNQICAVLSHSVVSYSLGPQVLQPTRLLCPWGFSRQEYRSGLPCPLAGYLPNPGIEPRSPTLQADSLPSEPPGKPKNTRVGSLSLLQGIFPTQESNPGLLHCRRILYYLSHQGSPRILKWVAYPFCRLSSPSRN